MRRTSQTDSRASWMVSGPGNGPSSASPIGRAGVCGAVRGYSRARTCSRCGTCSTTSPAEPFKKGEGMDFALSEDQLELQKWAHDFAEKEIRPVAAEYDETE